MSRRPARSTVRPARPLLLPALDGLVVTAAGVEAFDCPICEQPRDLVTPDCADPECWDDHDVCPDRACAVCGFAVVIGSTVAPAATRRGMTA